MLDHLERVARDPALRVLVLTGSGRQTFSSGYTLAAIRNELDDRFERVLDTLKQLPLPVVCALNGSVYGGATDLALCCDIRIGVRGSRLFIDRKSVGWGESVSVRVDLGGRRTLKKHTTYNTQT